MSNVIEVRELTKSYGNVTAVDAVSFRVEANKIYGLLGRNGAGKTTLMRMLTAQLFATNGEVKVFGEHVCHRNYYFSANVSVCPRF
nr:ATP-binding cassette domain-containing protein [Numidum massiliense]